MTGTEKRILKWGAERLSFVSGPKGGPEVGLEVPLLRKFWKFKHTISKCILKHFRDKLIVSFKQS